MINESASDLKDLDKRIFEIAIIAFRRNYSDRLEYLENTVEQLQKQVSDLQKQINSLDDRTYAGSAIVGGRE